MVTRDFPRNKNAPQESANDSGRLTSSSGLRSAATPQRASTAAAAIINAAPTK